MGFNSGFKGLKQLQQPSAKHGFRNVSMIARHCIWFYVTAVLLCAHTHTHTHKSVDSCTKIFPNGLALITVEPNL